MKRIVAIVSMALVCGAALADQYVQGHFRSDGSYVQGYFRSEPNSVKFDNYSAQGNTNPWTGERGSARSELSTPSIYDNSSYGNSGYGSSSYGGYRYPRR